MNFLSRLPVRGTGRYASFGLTPTSFSLATLVGHLEAGEIRFELEAQGPPDHYSFDIFSWARSSDAKVDFAYDKLKVAKAAQTEMWTIFCEKVVERLEAKATTDVTVESRRAPFQAEVIPVAKGAEPWQRFESRLRAIEGLKLNFELPKNDTFTTGDGWNVDRYECRLPAEAPGLPEVNGVFETAREILRNYEFPDPTLISGIYKPDEALADRTMLLQAHFLGLHFYFGVKIGQVFDEVRDTPDGQVQIWGYNYRTLEGHFERGEISFEIWNILPHG